MSPEDSTTYDVIAYYRSGVGPYPETGAGRCPIDIFDPRWYPYILGWSCLYLNEIALVLVIAPVEIHHVMATSGDITLLTQPQVNGLKQAIQAQQGLNQTPAMGVRRNKPNRQRLYVP